LPETGISLQNQQAVAGGLDSLPTNRHTNALFEFLDYRKLSDLPRELRQNLTRSTEPPSSPSAWATEKQQSLNLQRRTDDIRSGANGFSAAGLAINGQGPSYSGAFGITAGVAGPSGDDGKAMKESKELIPADFKESRWGRLFSPARRVGQCQRHRQRSRL